jgi:hypothetical protein
VGRHTAPDGDAVHPVVAEALARRPTAGEGSHRTEGPLGWPGEPPAPGSGGLGWPGDLAPTAPVAPVRDLVEYAIEDDPPDDDEPEQPAPPLDGGRRRGWRRLFGLDRAA